MEEIWGLLQDVTLENAIKNNAKWVELSISEGHDNLNKKLLDYIWRKAGERDNHLLSIMETLNEKPRMFKEIQRSLGGIVAEVPLERYLECLEQLGLVDKIGPKRYVNYFGEDGLKAINKDTKGTIFSTTEAVYSTTAAGKAYVGGLYPKTKRFSTDIFDVICKSNDTGGIIGKKVEKVDLGSLKNAIEIAAYQTIQEGKEKQKSKGKASMVNEILKYLKDDRYETNEGRTIDLVDYLTTYAYEVMAKLKETEKGIKKMLKSAK